MCGTPGVLIPAQHTASIKGKTLTVLNHLLQASIRINLHRIQVVKAVHFGGVFAELLGKGIGEIMCRVGGL
jgi:hypothetical protein